MSRIGKQHIMLPNGVTVKVDDGLVTVKGPKGELQQDVNSKVIISQEDNQIVVTVKDPTNSQQAAFWGLYQRLIANMVTGVTQGFQKQLEINGVGYKAAIAGQKLTLNLGYSHSIEYDVPAGIEVKIEKNIVTVSGIDKQLVGQVSANIRAFRKPEPYKGKGIKYVDEVIVRKAGKTAAKAAA